MSKTVDFTTLTPDKSETERFLKMLNPMGMQNYDFRTFDDFMLPEGKGRRLPSLNSKFRGTITEAFEVLCGHQRGGAGIFLTVNVTDGIGVKLTNIKGIRAVWIDDDEPRETHRTDFPIEPTIIVESSKGKYHYYWVKDYVSKFSFDTFKGVMRRFIQDWGHDKNASDVARVLRVPGFYHCKAEPFMTRVAGGSGKLVSLSELLKAFPPVEITPPASFNRETGEIDLRENDDFFVESVWEALRDMPIEFCSERDTWLQMGMAINHQFGDDGFPVWDQWSQGAKDKYDYEDCVRVWHSFGGKGIGDVTIQTVFHYAYGMGYLARFPINEEMKRNNELLTIEWMAQAAEKREGGTATFQDMAGPTVNNKLRPIADCLASEWNDNPPPEPEFLWGKIIPKKAVTLCVADGGTGKSFWAQILMNYIADGRDLFGLPLQQGKVIGIFGEDPASILYNRQCKIEADMKVDIIEQRKKLFIQEYVEFDVTMWRLEEATMFFGDLEVTLLRNPDIQLVVIDNSSISFSGNENARNEVHDFLRALNRLASKYDVSFLLLHHTSKSQGNEAFQAASGSTGWINGSRCGLRIKAEDKIAGTPMRLEHIKYNYSEKQDDIPLFWHKSVIKQMVGDLSEQDQEPGNSTIERKFLACLQRASKINANVSSKKKSESYCVKMFMNMPEGAGVRPAEFEKAIWTLHEAGIIECRGKYDTIHIADDKEEVVLQN